MSNIERASGQDAQHNDDHDNKQEAKQNGVHEETPPVTNDDQRDKQEAKQNGAHEETPPAVDASIVYTGLRTLLTALPLALGAGLVASLLAVALMITLRLVAGIPTPVELFSYFYLSHINYHTFLDLLNKFAPNSKTVPLALAMLGMIGIGTALSLLYAALVRLKLPVSGYRLTRREWLIAGGFTTAMTLVGIILFWEQIRQNLFGFPIFWERVASGAGLLADFALYGAALGLAYRALLPKQPRPGLSPVVQSRRSILTRAGVATLTVGAGAGVAGLVREYLSEYASYDGTSTPVHNLRTAPITPNDEHYIVTQNTLDPHPDAALWRLEVTGLVNNPGSYTYEEMQNLPSTSRAITLECISNGVGSHLMGTAIWHGVTLSTLLARHGGALSTASYVAFYGVDGYTTSLPLSDVLAADPILAWRMNGAVLPQKHGYPLRVIIPGRYGEESPKWLTRVEFSDHFIAGLYAAQGWYHGQLHTTSRVDYPQGRTAFAPTLEVGGIAFAGLRGIQKVEVSTDDGTTWQQASLKPALSQDSWVFWTWLWRPKQRGSYTLVVRATDGTGALQTSVVQRTVPNGSTGYDKVSVQLV